MPGQFSWASWGGSFTSLLFHVTKGFVHVAGGVVVVVEVVLAVVEDVDAGWVGVSRVTVTHPAVMTINVSRSTMSPLVRLLMFSTTLVPLINRALSEKHRKI